MLPMPPIELRRSVGPEDPAYFDNPGGLPVFGGDVELSRYERVLDFGCGCGRIARQMLQQFDNVPHKYIGLDLYIPSINWCKENLVRQGFEFKHLNVFNQGLNPDGDVRVSFNLDGEFSLIIAHSVFTHIIQDNLDFYFSECVKALENGGVLRTTWFLFNKLNFPMMQDFQNCLYINTDDLSNATIYDVGFVKNMFNKHGLRISKVKVPALRGYQWLIYGTKEIGDNCEFPEDLASFGIARPPTVLFD